MIILAILKTWHYASRAEIGQTLCKIIAEIKRKRRSGSV
jgi:hypothetical protein